MAEPNDHDLLAEFIRHESEEAFAGLVARYVNLVYSVAWRSTGNRHHAQEITQTVFIILARKAGKLAPGTVLSGWLYQAARLTAANFLKVEYRRQQREQEAYMQSTLKEPDAAQWEQLAPMLDAAIGRLGETDRNAIVLRFFENKTAAEAARALKLTEPAVHKRVNRALEKLRKTFSQRGVTLTAAMIAGVVTANSVQAAPAGLAATVGVMALKPAVVGGSTWALVQATMKLMAWVQYKTLIVTATVATLTGGVLVTAVLSEPARATSAGAAAPDVRETLTEAASLWLETPPGAVAVRPDGKIIVGTSLFGTFIDPQSGRMGKLDRLALQLNADGSLDRSFYCGAQLKASDAGQAHLELLPDGKFLATGMFNYAGDKFRPGYARFLADGSLDESFVPWFTNALWMPFPGRNDKAIYSYLDSKFGGLRPAAALSDGSVAVVENLGSSPLGVYRLDATGRLLSQTTNALPEPLAPNYPSLTPSFQFPVQNDGFWLEHLGNPATGFFGAFFAKYPIELFRIAAPLPDGGAVVGIRDRFVDGIQTAPGRFLRLDKNWLPDASFTNFYEADRRGSMTIKRLKDGKFLVAGGFTKMNGEDFPGIVRLNMDGRIDHGFNCKVSADTPWRPVTDFSLQADGRIVICGTFTAVNGVKRRYVARLNEDGSLDDSFKNPFIGLDEFQALRFPVYHLAAAAASSVAHAVAPGPLAEVAPPETILITSMKYQGGVARIQFTGNARETYVLQARDTLAAAGWTTISTNQADAGGLGNFSDADAINHPSRFYRIATP